MHHLYCIKYPNFNKTFKNKIINFNRLTIMSYKKVYTDAELFEKVEPSGVLSETSGGTANSLIFLFFFI